MYCDYYCINGIAFISAMDGAARVSESVLPVIWAFVMRKEENVAY
jgi:hypothetical protein